MTPKMALFLLFVAGGITFADIPTNYQPVVKTYLDTIGMDENRNLTAIS